MRSILQCMLPDRRSKKRYTLLDRETWWLLHSLEDLPKISIGILKFLVFALDDWCSLSRSFIWIKKPDKQIVNTPPAAPFFCRQLFCERSSHAYYWKIGSVICDKNHHFFQLGRYFIILRPDPDTLKIKFAYRKSSDNSLYTFLRMLNGLFRCKTSSQVVFPALLNFRRIT